MPATISTIFLIKNHQVEADWVDSLQSAVTQNQKDLEIICLCPDQQSTTKVQTLFPQIKLIANYAGSTDKAWNLGITKATGEYIAFLDSRGRYSQNSSLRQLYLTARREQADICRGERIYFAKNNDVKKSKMSQFSLEAVYFPFYKSNYELVSFIYRREFINEHQLDFTDRIEAEREFLVKYITQTDKFSVWPEVALSLDFKTIQDSQKITTNEALASLKAFSQDLKFALDHQAHSLYTDLIFQLNDPIYARNTQYGNFVHYNPELFTALLNATSLIRGDSIISAEPIRYQQIIWSLLGISSQKKKQIYQWAYRHQLLIYDQAAQTFKWLPVIEFIWRATKNTLKFVLAYLLFPWNVYRAYMKIKT